MKLNKLSFLVFLLFPLIIITLLLLMIFIPNKKSSKNNKKPNVVVSFYPLFFITSNLAKDTINISTIVPVGVEPHDFEPSQKQITDLQKADLIIINGVSFEPWIDKLQIKNDKILNLSKYIDLIPNDPHYWINPKNTEIMTSIISKKLSEINKNFYGKNSKNSLVIKKNEIELINILRKLDEEYQLGLSNCKQNTIIVSHDAFRYLAKQYNFNTMPIAGLSPESEPSLKKISELTNIIKEKNIKYIFFETLVSPKISETLAKEANVKTLVLNTIHGLTKEENKNNEDYVSLMYKNLKQLQKAMDCE